MTNEFSLMAGEEPQGPINEARANMLTVMFDKALQFEYQRAVTLVEGIRRRHPDWSDKQVAKAIADTFARDMSLAGAAAGGIAAIPVGGLAVRIGVGLTAETAYMVDRTANMILAVGECYGHDQSDFELRKFTLLRVLAIWSGASEASAMVAGGVGAALGKKTVAGIPMKSVYAINRAFGGRILVKWGTKTGVIRLGSVIPFGIGAAIGAGANYGMAKGLSKVAIKELSQS